MKTKRQGNEVESEVQEYVQHGIMKRPVSATLSPLTYILQTTCSGALTEADHGETSHREQAAVARTRMTLGLDEDSEAQEVSLQTERRF